MGKAGERTQSYSLYPQSPVQYLLHSNYRSHVAPRMNGEAKEWGCFFKAATNARILGFKFPSGTKCELVSNSSLPLSPLKRMQMSVLHIFQRSRGAPASNGGSLGAR